MPFRNILVPIDFDETSDHALKTAMDLAQSVGASVTVLHTVEIPPYAYAYFGAALLPPDMLSSLEAAALSRWTKSSRWCTPPSLRPNRS